MDNTKKRRKKRSFLQRVKRLGQNKSFCNKTKFESTEYEYYLRVFKMIRDFEGSDDEKVVFANNALAQTENREVECSSNQLISRVIEGLLPLASNKVMERYFNAFGKDLRPICNHEYSSHVLQALMVIATTHSLQNYETKDDNDHKDICQKWVLKVSKYLLNNIEEYISEKYANPVLRTAMYCLAGVPQMDKHNNSSFPPKKENNQKDITISQPTSESPKEFKQLLEEFFTRISKWPQFKDFVNNSLQSGFLQCLLTTLHCINSKQYKILSSKILTECFPFESNGEATALFSPSALPVLEVVIEKSQGDELKNIYKHLLSERLVEMSSMPVANFTVKKFLDKCDSPEMLKEIVPGLLTELPKILSQHYNSLLVSLCEACERLTSAQSEFFQGLVKALNCEDKLDQLVTAALSMKPLPHQTPSPPVTRLGSVLVQSLLRFHKPIKVVNSLLSYSTEQLTVLLCSQYGSHITDTFCTSKSIGEKSRQKLIQHLMGQFPQLATSTYGSRSFDSIWDVADDKSRVQITKDLSSSAHKVQNSKFGRFVATKVHLDDFSKLGVDKWKEMMQSVQRKRKLFDPLIGGKKKKQTNIFIETLSTQ